LADYCAKGIDCFVAHSFRLAWMDYPSKTYKPWFNKS
jgi:hypothetical protein